MNAPATQTPGEQSAAPRQQMILAQTRAELNMTLRRGESVLVNMKPKTHDVWTGNIYSRSSGSTYYATMTLKSSGKLHVEACAVGHFWCSGNDWTRAEERPEKLITTSRQWSARS